MNARHTLFIALSIATLTGGCIVRARPGYVASSGAGTIAQPAGAGVLLGERAVNFAIDRDTIALAARPDEFRSIYLEVVGGGVQLLDCDVGFENGGRMDLPVRQWMAPGSRTRAFDLPGATRNLRYVTLLYRPASAGAARAVVRVWGVR